MIYRIATTAVSLSSLLLISCASISLSRSTTCFLRTQDSAHDSCLRRCQSPGNRRGDALDRFVARIPHCVHRCGKEYGCGRPDNFVVMHHDLSTSHCEDHPAYKLAKQMIRRFSWRRGFPVPKRIGILGFQTHSKNTFRTYPYLMDTTVSRGYWISVKQREVEGDSAGAIAAIDIALRRKQLSHLGRMTARQGVRGVLSSSAYSSRRFVERGRDSVVYGLSSRTSVDGGTCRVFGVAPVDFRTVRILEVSYSAKLFPELQGDFELGKPRLIQRTVLPSAVVDGVIRRAGFDSYADFRASKLTRAYLGRDPYSCWGGAFSACRERAERDILSKISAKRHLEAFIASMGYLLAVKREVVWTVRIPRNRTRQQWLFATGALFRAMRMTAVTSFRLANDLSETFSGKERWYLALLGWYNQGRSVAVLKHLQRDESAYKKWKENTKKRIKYRFRVIMKLMKRYPIAFEDRFDRKAYLHTEGVASVNFLCAFFGHMSRPGYRRKDVSSCLRTLRRVSPRNAVSGMTYDGRRTPMKRGIGVFYFSLSQKHDG